MFLVCRWLLIVFALALGGEQFLAASAREERAYAAAASAFQDGMWSRAEVEFAQFAEKYPKSERVPEAVLMQAEADIKQAEIFAGQPNCSPRMNHRRANWPTSTFTGSARRSFKTRIMPLPRRRSPGWCGILRIPAGDWMRW